jgi:hypothetical protein
MKIVDRGYAGDIVLAGFGRIRFAPAGDSNRRALYLHFLPPQRFILTLITHTVPPVAKRMHKAALILSQRCLPHVVAGVHR